MSAERAFIEQLRAIATHPAARGLADDAAVLPFGDATLVLTHDALVEGVHFLAADPPADVAWKLLAVNLSDLAAKGAEPVGALMGYSLTGDDKWDLAFVQGLSAALKAFSVPLLGGDTVRATDRQLSMTLIGRATGTVPARSGARDGEGLFVTGSIGDAGAGLAIALSGMVGDADLLCAYRRPHPQLESGRALAPMVGAMMDVSDGLLIDSGRLAEASSVAIQIDLDAIPLSSRYVDAHGDSRESRIKAVTAGDDYQLLFTSAVPLPPLPCQVTRVGNVLRGQGLHLRDSKGDVALPARLGWEHTSACL